MKNDLKLKESDIRIYHSKYHECRAQNEVLREQLKNLQQQQNLSPISSGSPNELDDIIQYLAIENDPDQSSGSSSETGTVESGRCWVKAADVWSKVADVKAADVESKRPMLGPKWPMFGLKQPMFHRPLFWPKVADVV